MKLKLEFKVCVCLRACVCESVYVCVCMSAYVCVGVYVYVRVREREIYKIGLLSCSIISLISLTLIFKGKKSIKTIFIEIFSLLYLLVLQQSFYPALFFY